jgi:hypothetical protein
VGENLFGPLARLFNLKLKKITMAVLGKAKLTESALSQKKINT